MPNPLTRLQSTNAGLTVSIMRAAMGWIFFTEGSGKLWGWFGGQGVAAMRTFYDRIGVPFSPYHAELVGYTEFIGGVLLMAGLMTRLAAIPLLAAMIGAISILYGLSGGFHNQHIVGLVVCLVLLEEGGGVLSLDRKMSAKHKGPA